MNTAKYIVNTFELANVSKFQIPFGQFLIDFFEAFQSCTECLQSFNLKGKKYGLLARYIKNSPISERKLILALQFLLEQRLQRLYHFSGAYQREKGFFMVRILKLGR